MLKTQNIHAAESVWKLISCPSFPANFRHFVTFIIKIIFSQILTLGAARKAKLQWVYRLLHYPHKGRVFLQPLGPFVQPLVGWRCWRSCLLLTPFLLWACALRVTVPRFCAKVSQERFPPRPGKWLSPLCYRWLSLGPHPNPIASLCLYSEGMVLSPWMYFSEVSCNPGTTPPLPPKSYILPKFCRLLLKIEHALAACLTGQRAYCLSSLMSLLLLVSAGCFLGI